jgi:hypothetical protein
MRRTCLLALAVCVLALPAGRAEIVKGALGITGAEMK